MNTHTPAAYARPSHAHDGDAVRPGCGSGSVKLDREQERTYPVPERLKFTLKVVGMRDMVPGSFHHPEDMMKAIFDAFPNYVLSVELVEKEV